MSLRKSLVIFVFIWIFGTCTAVEPAYAIDKRLKLAFKTGGYGAAAGFVIGAGTMALGLGNYRNMLMGASSGLYAGILFAVYIVASQPDKKKLMRSKNPYAPRQPIDEDTWEEDDDEDHFKENLPPEANSKDTIQPKIGPGSPYLGAKDVEIWSPVFTLRF
jgi:hypothetical protein